MGGSFLELPYLFRQLLLELPRDAEHVMADSYFTV